MARYGTCRACNATSTTRTVYQAAHYEEAGLLLSRLIGEAQRAARELAGDGRRAAFGVLAQTYHATAKTLTKVSDTELAWIAAERSLQAAQWAESRC
jgi:hypothetical protein